MQEALWSVFIIRPYDVLLFNSTKRGENVKQKTHGTPEKRSLGIRIDFPYLTIIVSETSSVSDPL